MEKINDIPKRTTSWVHKDLKLKESKINGLGLFATKDIAKGEIISVFGGKIYTSSEIDRLPETSNIVNVVTQVNEDFFIGPLDDSQNEWGYYINHSCDPNCKIYRSILLIAIKDVGVGDEITFDYAHSHNKLLDFKCNCKSVNCRKFIANNDYDNENYQKNNYKYFTEWIKEKIMSSKKKPPDPKTNL